jgi:tetratricopeptide (TPR) repeat protein
MPATVQAILAARIDRLAPEAKRLLQAAAVIGKDVPFPLLLAIADAPEEEVRAELARLQAAEFLYETRLFPDLEYTFKHALTHEVAYQGLLRERQRALHARITEALERLSSERIAEHAERLAHHAVRGEQWEKAVGYLHQAGRRAMERGATRAALDHLEQALGTVRRLPETRETAEQTIDIRFDIRNSLLPLGDRTRMGEQLHAAEILARRIGDQRRLARTATFMVIQSLNTGDYAEAIRFGQEALSLARAQGDRAIEVVATSFVGMTHAAMGDFGVAVSFLERNVALESELRDERFGAPAIQWALCCAQLADVNSQLGRFEAGMTHAEAAMSVAEAADQPFTLYWALLGLGLVFLRRGEFSSAARILERGLDLCRTSQVVVAIPTFAATLAAAYALGGRADEALRLIADPTAAARRGEIVRPPAWILLCAATVYLAAGRLDEAAETAREAKALSGRLGARASLAEALCLSGDIAAAAGMDDAEKCYREALALAGNLGMSPLVGQCHLGLGRLYRGTGRPREADEHLATAVTMFREMGMRFWLDQAQAAMTASP